MRQQGSKASLRIKELRSFMKSEALKGDFHMKRFHKPNWQKQISRERIEILFNEAEKIFKEKPERAKSYVKQAWNIALRYRVRIPTGLKRSFCKKCFSYLKAGVSSTVRLNKKRVIITCKNCGAVKRIPYNRAKPEVSRAQKSPTPLGQKVNKQTR